MSDFTNTNVGDKVVLIGRIAQLRTVEKVYKIHFTLNGSTQRYRKSNGWSAAEGYHHDYVIPADDIGLAAVEASRVRELADSLRHVDWRSLPAQTLDAVYALLKAKPSPPAQTPAAEVGR